MPGYDAVGNITRIETSTPGTEDVQTYSYDELDRLTSWILDGADPVVYDYDDFGRLDDKGDLDLEYNTTAGFPFHAVTGTDAGDEFFYDANGSMITRTVDTETFAFAYSGDNRLVAVDGDAGFSFVGACPEERRDGDGNRVKAIDLTSGETTYYVGNYFEVAVPALDPYCAAVDLSIPNGNSTGAGDTITIPSFLRASSGTSGTIADLTVYLEVDHTKVGELLVTLEHDDTSTIIDLLDKPGDPTPGMCTGNNVDGTFDDDAADIAESDCAHDPADPALGGSFQPNGSLSDFDSESLNGDWTLKVVDRTSGSYSGTPSLALGASFVSWCLTATGPTADAGGVTPVTDGPAPLKISPCTAPHSPIPIRFSARPASSTAAARR